MKTLLNVHINAKASVVNASKLICIRVVQKIAAKLLNVGISALVNVGPVLQ